MSASDPLVRRRGLGPETAAVLVAAVVWGSVFFDRFGSLYIIGEITHDLDVSLATGGVLPFAIGIGFAGAALLAVVVADRLPGNRRTLVLGSACAGVLSLLSATAETWFGFSLLRGLTALTAGILAPAITSVVYARAPTRRLGRDIGIVQATNRLTSGLLCPVVFSVVAAAASWREAVAIGGALLLVASGLAWFLLPPDEAPVHRRPADRGARRLPAEARASVVIATFMAVSLLTWLVVFSQSAIRLLGGWQALDLQQAGALAAWFGVGGVVAAVGVPTVSDRIGRGAATAMSGTIGGGAGLLLAIGAATQGAWLPPGPLVLLAGAALGALPLAVSIIPAEAVRGAGIAKALAAPLLLGETLGAALLPAAAAYLAGDSLARLNVVVGVAAGQVVLVGVVAGLLLRASHDRR